MQESNDFATTIATIGQEVKQLGVLDELFSSKAFNQVYENPVPHFAAALALLARSDISAHEKMIVGYAMQRLPPEKFVAFVSGMADAVEHGQTDMSVLEATAFAPLNFGHQALVMYYKNPVVQELLERLLRMRALSLTHRDYIKQDLLTGKARTDYLDYLAMMGRPLPE